MKKNLQLILYCFLIFIFLMEGKEAKGQTQFLNSFPGAASLKLCQKYDGGYGLIKCNNSSVTFMNLNGWGEIENQKSYLLPYPIYYTEDIIQTNDSGFIFSCDAGDKSLILKINAIGDTLWTKSLGINNNRITINNIKQKNDGTYMLFGGGQVLPTGAYYNFVIRLNNAGDTIFTKSFGIQMVGSGRRRDLSGIITNDNGYLSYGVEGFWIKMDAAGNNLWTYKSNFDAHTDAKSIDVSVYNEYFAVSANYSSTSPLVIEKLDSNGNFKWDKVFQANDKVYNCLLKCTYDGGFVVLGSIINFPSGATLTPFILKCDSGGNIQYKVLPYDTTGLYGMSFWTPNDLRITSDSGFICAFDVPYNIIIKKYNKNGLSSCSNLPCNLQNGTLQPTFLPSLTFGYFPYQMSYDTCQIVSTSFSVNKLCSNIGSASNVWPGDCNYDFTVDNLDFLYLNIANGTSGTSRLSPSINWQPQPSTNWTNYFANGANYKHADCDGNGIVDSMDATAIYQNYNLQHTYSRFGNPAINSINPTFELKAVEDTITIGDTVHFEIRINSSGGSVDSLYGLAYSIEFDSSLIDSNYFNFDYSFSILDTTNNNIGSFNKKFFNYGYIDAAVSRTDHNNANNISGVIGTINIKVKDSLPVLSYLILKPFLLKALTVNEANINFTGIEDTVVIVNCDSAVLLNFITPTSICFNDTISAEAILSFPAQTDWYLDSIFVSSNQNISIPNLSIGSHEIKLVVNNTYCKKEVISNVTIHALPLIELGSDTSTCNLSVTLDAGIGNISYQWSSGETTQTIVANVSANYSVLITDTNGCSNADTINVLINPLPTVQLGNDTSTCNVPVALDAGSGNISYQWSTGETTQTLEVNSSSLYSVVVTDINGCSNADSISITINPVPVVTFNAFTNSDTLCINSGVQTINSGNPQGGNFSGIGVTGNQFDPNIAGAGLHYITYQFTDSNGCSNSATDSVWVDLCLGISLISKDETFIIYPNPVTSNSLYIGYLLSRNKSGEFQIINTTGQVVYQYNLPQGSNEHDLQLPSLANGIYSATIISDNKRVSKTIAIIK